MKFTFYLFCLILLTINRESYELPIPNIRVDGNILQRIYEEKIYRSVALSITDSKCFLCQIAVKGIEEMLSLKIKNATISDFITDICITFSIETPRVCRGIVSEFKSMIFTVLLETNVNPKEACAYLLGSECPSIPEPYLRWNVSLPNIPKPPVVPINPPKPSSPLSRVLQISDVHLDLLYKPGSFVNCKEPLCCRDMVKHLRVNSTAGKWGESHYCDTPLNLFENMLQYISQTQKFDYIMLTGDLPAHDVWNQTKESQIKVLKLVTKLLIQYFPKTPIYPALGNHESAPVNGFPPPYVRGNVSIDWLYNALVKTWTTWLPNSTINSIKMGAYYSILVQPGFRIISINMNYCNNLNMWLFINMTDPADELSWLVNELQQAENNKEKVHIIGHIPPGHSDCIKTWSWNYYRIINRYESTVRVQFFGHTHFDEFELFYDESNLKRPISIAYIGPSVTPYYKLFPGFRIYTIDGDYAESSRVVLDHETYIVNLTEANLFDNPKWFKEYSAKDAYNMTSLLPQDWNNLINSMKTNDTLFDIYYKFYYKSFVHGPCDKTCKNIYLCSMKSGRSFDPDICIP